MGGGVPLGYDLSDRRLVINPAEAETVRLIFELYLDLKTLSRVEDELDRRSIVSKRWVSKEGVPHGGFRFRRGALYHLLANPIYVGEIRHKKVSYPGQHEPTIELASWDRVREMLNLKAGQPRGAAIKRTTGLLMGKLFDESGEPRYSCWAKKGTLRYRYFVSRKLVRGTNTLEDHGWRLSAGRTEEAVTAAALQMLSDRGALVSTLKAWGLSAAELKQAVETIEGRAKLFQQIGTMEEPGAIIERVELSGTACKSPWILARCSRVANSRVA